MKNGVKEWIMVADKDMLTIANLVKCETIVTDSVAFHCQQAIEKYFKAYLLENGWQLQKTHDLANLYGEIKKIKDLQIDEKVLSKIDDVYVDIRYPDDYREPTGEEVEAFYKFTQEVAKKIKQELM